MSIDAARMTSSIAETSWNMIFAPSKSITASKQLQHNDSVLWLWTALGLSVFGLKLCNDALEFYRFFAAWNRVWRRNHRLRGGNDDHLEPTQKSLDRRKRQINKNVTTLTFGELQKQLFGIGASVEKTCVICLEDFEKDDRVSCSETALSENKHSCRHFFHTECLHSWLVKHTSCPTCRHRMLPDPEPMPWLSSTHR